MLFQLIVLCLVDRAHLSIPALGTVFTAFFGLKDKWNDVFLQVARRTLMQHENECSSIPSRAMNHNPNEWVLNQYSD